MTEENKNMAAEAVKKEQSAPAKKTENAATSRKIGNKPGFVRLAPKKNDLSRRKCVVQLFSFD